MNDTPKHILKKQLEIINKRSDAEKIERWLELTELSRTIILDQLREKHPEMSERDLIAELFKIFYKNDFTPEKLNIIAESIREYKVS
ncbi:MAG TPA: hypothetical protein PLW37_08515 [bacterium]|jgi:hypothetical protein|nr:hypothetical protein [bacterium]HOG42651.1 hypothetical protein [bacterium]HQB09897.1 hypothetical protein [bacterium]